MLVYVITFEWMKLCSEYAPYHFAWGPSGISVSVVGVQTSVQDLLILDHCSGHMATGIWPISLPEANLWHKEPWLNWARAMLFIILSLFLLSCCNWVEITSLLLWARPLPLLHCLMMLWVHNGFTDMCHIWNIVIKLQSQCHDISLLTYTACSNANTVDLGYDWSQIGYLTAPLLLWAGVRVPNTEMHI